MSALLHTHEDLGRLALVFDVDGTLADTEEAHRQAFNEAFAAEGLPWHWSVPLYTRLLGVSGGKERLAAYHREVEGSEMPGPLLERVHAEKTLRYVAKVEAGQIELRPGIRALLDEAQRRRVTLAIATTTSPANVRALLRCALGDSWRDAFAAVGDASTAPRKKPDPQVYLGVLEALGRPGEACLAFEDSHNGLAAARAAGIPTVVTPTPYTASEDFAGALAVLPHLAGQSLDDLLRLRSEAK